MWDITLKQLDKDHTPQQATTLWGGDVKSLTLVSEGVNVVYRFSKVSKWYYLRITHAALRNYAELSRAIKFQNHLATHAVPICAPIKSLNNELIEVLQQQELTFFAHVCSEVPGVPITFNNMTPQLYRTWGSSIAKLHLAAEIYSAPEDPYTNWQESLTELYTYARHEAADVQNELTKVANYLRSHKQTKINYGLNHGDHRKGNVLTNGVTVNIIDFDLPSYGWFMQDIIRPFFSAVVNKNKNWQDKLAPYLEGYMTHRRIADEDLRDMPWMLRFKALEIYLWTKYNWSGDIAPGGIATKQWLADVYQMIIDHTWLKQFKSPG